jgi:hypothetical protein
MDRMQENQIVNAAIAGISSTAMLKASWKAKPQNGFDGVLRLWGVGIVPHLSLWAEVKADLRSHQIARIIERAAEVDHFILIAQRLSPAVKQELRKEKISYIEANGNIYWDQAGSKLWIDTAKSLAGPKQMQSYPFSKTGLRIVFDILLDPDMVNLTYRRIAVKTGISLGSVTNIINGLRDAGFIIPTDKGRYLINNKIQLLGKWVEAYEEKLKPKIKIGEFRFLKNEEMGKWRDIHLSAGKSWWGGEAGGAILTKYLQPQELTLYTVESRSDLMRKYKMIPDKKGNIQVYERFWGEEQHGIDTVVPAILVYADLIHSQDSRCLETAKIIYETIITKTL